MTDEARHSETDASDRVASVALAAILVVATLLRLVNLDDQLWLDEISALTGSIQRSFLSIVTVWPGSASHILYELLARLGLVTVGLPIGIRLPAVIFGVAGVALVYAFARLAFGSRPALFIASLLAVSYHHVFFSQNARGYTLLMALYLATLLLLRTAQQRGVTTRLLVMYALSGALAAYSMPMGLFILPAQVTVLLGLWLRARAAAEPAAAPARLVVAAVCGGLIAALLYAPFVEGIVGFTRTNVALPEEGPRLGIGLAREVLDGLLGAFHGPAGVAAVAIFGVAGVVTWWRRDPVSLALAMAPLLLEAAVVVAVGIGIHPRYFAIALPVMLIVAGLGVDSAVTAAVQRLPIRRAQRVRTVGAVLAVVALLSAWPLARYYRYPKQDVRGAIATVDALQPPCDLKVGVGVAGHMITGYYGAPFTTVENLLELQRAEREATGQVCVVTTLEVLLQTIDAQIVRHLHTEYRPVALLPGTLGDGAMRIYARHLP